LFELAFNTTLSSVPYTFKLGHEKGNELAHVVSLNEITGNTLAKYEPEGISYTT
jgi:hypothetical protein